MYVVVRMRPLGTSQREHYIIQRSLIAPSGRLAAAVNLKKGKGGDFIKEVKGVIRSSSR